MSTNYFVRVLYFDTSLPLLDITDKSHSPIFVPNLFVTTQFMLFFLSEGRKNQDETTQYIGIYLSFRYLLPYVIFRFHFSIRSIETSFLKATRNCGFTTVSYRIFFVSVCWHYVLLLDTQKTILLSVSLHSPQLQAARKAFVTTSNYCFCSPDPFIRQTQKH